MNTEAHRVFNGWPAQSPQRRSGDKRAVPRSRSRSLLQMLSPGRFHFLLQPVTTRSLQTLLCSNSSPRPLPHLDEMLQTIERSHSRFTTDNASPTPFHPQLVLALAGNRQIRELIFDWLTHFGAGTKQPWSDHVKFQLRLALMRC